MNRRDMLKRCVVSTILVKLGRVEGLTWQTKTGADQVSNLRVVARRILFTPGRNEFTIALAVHNDDKSATATAEAILDVDPGLTSITPQKLTLEVPPNGDGLLKWKVGVNSYDARLLAVEWRSGKIEIPLEYKIQLEPSLLRAILAPGEETDLQVRVVNVGQALTPDETVIEVSASPRLRLVTMTTQRVPAIVPGEHALLTWRVKAMSAGEATLTATVRTPSLGPAVEAKARGFVTPEVRFLNAGDSGSCVVLRKGTLQLKCSKGLEGVGVFAVDLRDGNTIRRLAMAPAFGKFVYGDSKGLNERLFAGQLSATHDGNTAAYVDRWLDADQVSWEARVSFTLLDEARIEVRCVLGAKAKRNLLAFHGPLILAGEQGTGARKDAALLPGVEWLEGMERSSSLPRPALTVPEPFYERYVPHPNKITVPVAGIMTDGRMVGLMWDPLQKWDGTETRPSLVFASPNWLSGQNNHAMGLFVPSIPEWVKENHVLAAKPYEMAPGKELSITFTIIQSPAADALAPVRLWYHLNGSSSPDQLKRTYEDEIKSWAIPTTNRTTDILDYMHPYTLASGSLAVTKSAMEWLQVQQPDGAWIFDWDLDPGPKVLTRLVRGISDWPEVDDVTKNAYMSSYGVVGDTSIGTCTVEGGISGVMPGKAISVLRAARLTGRPELLVGAKRALERMNKFVRPEGAQTWEEPLHTPDLLAAAYAIQAFVEGYRLTGEKRWVDAGEKWAWMGLPFVNTWSAPDQMHMKYSTIAYVGLLSGMPVTWNGLEYAKGLIELSEYLPPRAKAFWRTIAEGIVMWVLKVDRTPFNGKWPDWLNLLTGAFIVEGGLYADDRPGRLLAMLRGLVVQPETAVTAYKGRPIRITAEGEVVSAIEKGSELLLHLLPATRTDQFEVAIGGISSSDIGNRQSGRGDQLQMTIRIVQPERASIVSYEYFEGYGLLNLHCNA
jgi:hypothetical protein